MTTIYPFFNLKVNIYWGHPCLNTTVGHHEKIPKTVKTNLLLRLHRKRNSSLLLELIIKDSCTVNLLAISKLITQLKTEKPSAQQRRTCGMKNLENKNAEECEHEQHPSQMNHNRNGNTWVSYIDSFSPIDPPFPIVTSF